MPTFNDVEVTITVDVDFEVFCGTCGTGLCSESDTRSSRNRRYAQVTVNACPYCIDKKNEEINDLEYKIEQLEEELSKLEVNV